MAIRKIKRIHHKLFLAYGALFLLTIGGVFGAASIFIKRNFDQQIQEDAKALRTRVAHTVDQLRLDIVEKVRLETETPDVVRFVRSPNAANLPDLQKSALEILEYGNDKGFILASKGDTAFREGTRDDFAFSHAHEPSPFLLIRRREQPTIEVSLPIQRGGVFMGFVTGGYFLQSRLTPALQDQSLHPIFLNAQGEMLPLNSPADTIPEAQRGKLLIAEGVQQPVISKEQYTVNRISLLGNHIDSEKPVELIVAYSHRNATAFRNQLLTVLLIVAGVGLGVAYVISFLIGFQITRPLDHLAKGAATVASGDLEHHVPVEGRDEIGQLAAAFNQMAADLKANMDKRIAAERMAAWRDVARRVAHEIKNPLFPIRLSIENLRRTYRSKPAVFGEIFDECTETVIEEVERLQRMVDEFHQFARMPAPERKASDVNEIVQAVLNLYAASAAGIRVEASLEPTLPMAYIDPEQMSQVLGNLIKNAIEAMPNGGALKVSTHQLNDGRIAIEIHDTGVGMSPEALSEIFKPYYTTKERGTGLGMAIVQRIVSDHGGSTAVESTENVGTTVRIELPLGQM